MEESQERVQIGIESFVPRRIQRTDTKITGDMVLGSGQWFALGSDWVCRTWHSRRERKWCAVVHPAYGGEAVNVMGFFDSPEKAAAGAAMMIEQRRINRIEEGRAMVDGRRMVDGR